MYLIKSNGNDKAKITAECIKIAQKIVLNPFFLLIKISKILDWIPPTKKENPKGRLKNKIKIEIIIRGRNRIKNSTFLALLFLILEKNGLQVAMKPEPPLATNKTNNSLKVLLWLKVLTFKRENSPRKDPNKVEDG